MWRKGVKRINYTIYELHVKIRENLPKSIKNRQYKLNVWIKFIKFHSGNTIYIMNETHFFLQSEFAKSLQRIRKHVKYILSYNKS